MKVKNFNKFINESEDTKNVAGIAFVWDGKLLLVHPTNASWQHSALGIPKGGIKVGEDPLDAAIREVFEETGIEVDPSKLDSEPHTVPRFKKDGSIDSQMIYFIMRIDDPSDIGMIGHKIDKEKLQLEEIDWAGFVKIEDAYPKIHKSQLIILDRVR
jgi:8-oxo-dGTP pyrophosphatase MutT (NUDIX family)